MSAQLPDLIVVEGVNRELYSNPLETYWTFFDTKRPTFRTTPTCKRGYIATWLIRNNELYITSIEGIYMKWSLFSGRMPAPFTLKSLFPRGRFKPVKAIWYSGKLRVPTGRMTMYEHSGYDSRFERELIITVDRGNVLRLVTLDNTEKKLTVDLERDEQHKLK